MSYTSPTNLARRQSLINSLRQTPAGGYQKGPLGALAQGLNAYTAASQGSQIDQAQTDNENLRLKDMSQLVTNLRDETNTENLDATTTGIMLPPDIRPPIVSPPITHPAVKELELAQMYNQQLAQTRANTRLANQGRFENVYENGVLVGQRNDVTGEMKYDPMVTLQTKIEAQENRAEENFKRRSELNLYNSGQEYNKNNKLVDIVGATPYRTNTRNHADDVSELRSIQSTVQSAVDNIDEILSTENKSGFDDNFGGYTASVTRYMPDILPSGWGGTTALDVKAKLEKLGSDMANSGLNTARAGGSIGQITEKEWPMLQKMVANITYSLSEGEARKQLKKAREKFVQFALNADEKYINTWDYGEQQYYNKDVTSKGMGLDFANKTEKPTEKPLVVDDQFTRQEAAANAEANQNNNRQVLKFDAQGNLM
tara:strand:- start:779 stop:2062 length:1284 start_codon:yes stop_codon:yes gene_type:complete